MASFTKFVRPETPTRGIISDRDLDIIEAILRYRFSPTSELVRLVGGNEDVTQRRLRRLWEAGVVNRFGFPGIRTHSEFLYYLVQRQTLELLIHCQRQELTLRPTFSCHPLPTDYLPGRCNRLRRHHPPIFEILGFRYN